MLSINLITMSNEILSMTRSKYCTTFQPQDFSFQHERASGYWKTQRHRTKEMCCEFQLSRYLSSISTSDMQTFTHEMPAMHQIDHMSGCVHCPWVFLPGGQCGINPPRGQTRESNPARGIQTATPYTTRPRWPHARLSALYTRAEYIAATSAPCCYERDLAANAWCLQNRPLWNMPLRFRPSIIKCF